MKFAGLLTVCVALTWSAHAQDWARKQLEKSPRHQEWVDIKHDNRAVHAFVVYPEVKEKAPAILVIHENKGLTEWVENVADQLAALGYIAIAPDLLSGAGPNGGKTADFPNPSAATQAIYQLPPEQVTADLDAVAAYVSQLPAANGTLRVAGFCWGGGQSFRYAAHRQDLKAAFVFYGSPPSDAEAYSKIACPVYGFYGGNDARIDETIPKTIEQMKQAGKTFDPVIYEGAGHGFMRSGQQPDAEPDNKRAHDQAWARWKDLLKP